MGKSSKKVKNERINTLRKKYDAFLEEDKKRKERNEYILGKLDKMRLSSSLIPSSTKVNCLEANLSDVYVLPNSVKKNPAIYDNHVFQLERKHVNNSAILNEISKKFILIPKRTVLTESKYTYHKDAIDDRDWKSKYNILDDLKKQEKEGYTDAGSHQTNEICLSSQQDTESSTQDKSSHNLGDNSNHFNRPICLKNNDLTDVNKAITSLEQGKNNNSINFGIADINSQSSKENLISPQNPSIVSTPNLKDNNVETDDSIKHAINKPDQENVREIEDYYSTDNEKNKLSSVNNLTQNIDNHFQIKEQNDNQLNYQENEFQSNYNQPPDEAGEYVAHENVSDALYSKQIVSDIKPQGTSAVEFSQEHLSKMYENQNHPSENQELASVEQAYDVKDNNAKGPIESNQNTYEVEYYELTKENIPKDISHENTNKHTDHLDHTGETQDLRSAEQLYGDVNQPVSHVESNQNTFDETQHYDATQDMIPVVIENTENVNLDSEINAFEAEQKEMFYTEQTDGDAYAYNQEDENTGKYTAQEYEQNDQYAYYEGVQQDQTYSTGINEHEESTERYDPHYNQQYEASYDNQQPDSTINYENTNAYEQQQFQDGTYESPQFENTVNYENQQDNTNLYQNENASNQNEKEEIVIAAQGDQMYNENVYTDQSDSQEKIEQQLSIEEGVVEIPSNVGEYHKENEPINEIMDTTAPVEQSPNPKYI